MKFSNHLASVLRMSFCFLFLSSSLFAQDDDVTDCPYFNISSTDTSGVVFSLLSTNIDATISGVIANVVVEQLYTNGGDSIVDATYVFPMSSQAAIYGMEMDVNDKTIIAEIRRKAEAEAIFESADSSGLTASLLEQERPNVFQMSLANINPGDSITVRMVYTELMVPTNGVYQFVFPNIVGPRFTTNGEPWIYQTSLDAIPLSETDLNIDLKINAGMTVSAECTSHIADFDSQGTTAQTSITTTPGDDFIVDYTLDEDQIVTGLLLYEDVEENFFLSMIQPRKPDLPYESPQREYVFIMDISGSMSGIPIETSKLLITSLLNDLNSDDKFNIVFFAGGSSTLSPSSLPVNSANIDLAINTIDNLSAGGSTQLINAMQTALDLPGTAEYSRTFVILTDGYVTVEKEAFQLIRENLNEANFFSFGIGGSVNRYIIEGIAYVGEGEAFVVTDNDDATEMATTFKTYIENPVLTNIEATFEGIEVYDVEPLTIPDVFAERPIIIYGKYLTPSEGMVTINGDYVGGEVINSLDFSEYTANNEENIALKYLWARKKIKLMSDYEIGDNPNDTLSIEEEITQLGLKYSLITEYTSFVAVDSSALSTSSGGANNDSGGDGGTITDISSIHTSDENKEFIKVLGTITRSEGWLKLQLENLNLQTMDGLSLQITSVSGHTIKYSNFDTISVDGVIAIPIGALPAGMYFVSLLSKDRVLDTEGFIVK